MLRIAICDDDTHFLEQLYTLLMHWPGQPDQFKVDRFSNGNALIEAHAYSPYQMILIDVVMPALNGIETAREIRASNTSAKIVFLTQSPEYAVESYTVKASNYLLKPVNPAALYACLDELEEERSRCAKTIPVRTASSMHWIDLENIEYVEAQNKVVLYALVDGTTLQSIDPLYTHIRRLTVQDGFFKCHRSYIVNMNQISTYTQKEIQMRSGCRIPISRSCHKEFEQIFFSSIFGSEGGTL